MANTKVLFLTQIVLILSLTIQSVKAQNTVFSVLKKDNILADKYYADQRYQSALELYLRIDSRETDPPLHLKIARSFYFLRRYDEARRWYDKALTSGTLPQRDIYYYAETLSALKDYRKAAETYGRYLQKDPENEFIVKKIWRLDNIRFLYEDSAHYALRPVDVNSEYDDMAAVPYRDGLVFMSNRKTVQVVENIDASTNASFFRLYYSRTYIDSLTDPTQARYTSPEIWQKNGQKFHEGPVAFFNNGKRMVFTRTAKVPGKNGRRTLQLFFAEKRDARWEETGAFPFNSHEYSITDPSISNDGSVLYFSSDMEGGKGAKDLYRSQNVSGKWTKPVNLADINTPYDEVSPYLARNRVLYFSSNGHAGLGGLDIFKVSLDGQASPDIQNPGYPLNTNADEFAFVIDSLNTHGYITSNRKNAGNDDIYEFEIDLQTYPITIDGVLKFKEVNWTDSAEVKVMSNAKLSLIDNIRNMPVVECISDSAGLFRLEIPYFSTYKIKVTGEDHHETMVSLEVQKHRKADSNHEIVVVKDPFKSKPNEVPK